MPTLRLESELDTLDLDGIASTGQGVQALSGAGGFGLPQVSVQWLEGAGDGATYRGRRVLPRDIDLPLFFQAHDRAGLQDLLSRFARMMAGRCTLRLIEDDGSDWSTTVYRIGGGDYVYGADTIGETEFQTTVTLRAGDPYWTSSRAIRQEITNRGAGRGLLGGSLMKLAISSSQAVGEVQMENPGDAEAYPVWTARGPGRDLKAISSTGQGFEWLGTLAAGETLTIDTKTGLVQDDKGQNRYEELAPSPRLWTVPPGISMATISMQDVDGSSLIVAQWRPRKWMVV
ncbi:phage tail family protein [Kineococcus esterisolvens]|uniref:phage tail family protein n=1 Tax=unclassified Kineococcus TaxID=2621656 RepID=UPI003D7CB000